MSLPIQVGFVALFRVLCAVGLCLVVREGRRVLQVEVVVQPEVDEAEHGRVELDEDGHEAQVHALGRVVGELRGAVSSKLSQTFKTKVDSSLKSNLRSS